MRSLPAVALSLILIACAGASGPPTTTAPATTSTTATTAPSSTTTTAPPPPCPPPPYEVGSLPPAVEPAGEGVEVEPDEFTSIGGINATLWVNGEGDLAIALVRGTLPPNQFPAERGEVEVAGSRGVAGPYPDGRWVVAWFNEPGDRCDQYTMVFHPPVSPEEVEATLSSLVRTPG